MNFLKLSWAFFEACPWFWRVFLCFLKLSWISILKLSYAFWSFHELFISFHELFWNLHKLLNFCVIFEVFLDIYKLFENCTSFLKILRAFWSFHDYFISIFRLFLRALKFVWTFFNISYLSFLNYRVTNASNFPKYTSAKRALLIPIRLDLWTCCKKHWWWWKNIF